MRFAFVCGTVCAVGLAGFACNPGFEMFPPGMGCTNDGGGVCMHASGGIGSGTGAADGGTGVGGGTTELTGSVGLVTAFDGTPPGTYLGVANVVAPGPMGSVSVPLGGSAGHTFDLMGILSGQQWILVQDTTMGGANIISTYSPVLLPSAAPVVVPVVELSTLSTIANNLPSLMGQGVSPLAAQVVLSITKGGSPYKGVSLSGVPGGAHIVYDTGTDVYSDTATATGTGGTIILFNAGISGLSTLTLLDTSTMAQYQVVVQAAPGTATLAGVPFQ